MSPNSFTKLTNENSGIGNFILQSLKNPSNKDKTIHFFISSGGNAGLAAACAAHALGLRCTVFLPHGVNQSTIDFLRKEGAEVEIGGDYDLQALQRAQAAVAAEAKA